MKKILRLLLLLVPITSCNSIAEQHTTPYGQIPVTVPGVDPYFVEPKDTISSYGPHHITRNILQDKNGIFWFATWEGLIRYDGKFFTNVTLEKSLKHYRVFYLLEDKTGNLWFGTIGAGVYYYNGKTFTNFTTENGLANNSIGCMLADNNGNIWFGTQNGVSRYDPSTSRFTNFTAKDGLIGNSINSIAQDKTGKLWFGTNNGVSCYDGKSLSAGQPVFTDFLNTDGKDFQNVRSIIEDKTGNIWIGGADGLFRYDSKSVSAGQTGLTRITVNFVGYIFEDKQGNLWLSEGEIQSPGLYWNANDGMSLYSYDGKSHTKIITKNSTGDKQVFGITQDKDGNIWFGTMNGVLRYNSGQSPGETLGGDAPGFTGFTEKESK